MQKKVSAAAGVAVADEEGCLQGQCHAFHDAAGALFDGVQVAEGGLDLAHGRVEAGVGAGGAFDLGEVRLHGLSFLSSIVDGR
ncbi:MULTISPECIES: hypothetical protein [Actinomadura]|uniref:hypothetical protein n=1 Tax=Actinomadura TaxID=1988 RepID=UPI0026154132|nr:hypothetical protein [Actinomadura geliboluensis]